MSNVLLYTNGQNIISQSTVIICHLLMKHKCMYLDTESWQIHIILLKVCKCVGCIRMLEPACVACVVCCGAQTDRFTASSTSEVQLF